MEPVSTPRISGQLIGSYIGRNVMIIGKVLQLRGDSAIIDAEGQITIMLNRDVHLTPGNGVQVIGKVNPDFSVKVLSGQDLGDNVDYQVSQAVVDATHRYKHLRSSQATQAPLASPQSQCRGQSDISAAGSAASQSPSPPPAATGSQEQQPSSLKTRLHRLTPQNGQPSNSSTQTTPASFYINRGIQTNFEEAARTVNSSSQSSKLSVSAPLSPPPSSFTPQPTRRGRLYRTRSGNLVDGKEIWRRRDAPQQRRELDTALLDMILDGFGKFSAVTMRMDEGGRWRIQRDIATADVDK
ncbi:hypothetical protein DL764_002755 [Monosporascus ibericus]|uniref:Replication factor A protein 3 n=1 Tax=Monosporascus ibericus TaxID=155417 RepID=A0A4Q4TLQ1_9PEZI|nr:hypothetical protein DL764_002755 [Monosporascus ibericus]